MKVSIKRSELPMLYRNLSANLAKYKGAKLAYAVVKNLKALENEVNLIDKVRQSEEFQEFNSRRIAVCEGFAEISETGEPVYKNGSYVIKDQESFEEAVAELKAEYQKVFDDFDAFLNETCELDVHCIKAEHLSDDMTGDLVSLLVPFLE